MVLLLRIEEQTRALLVIGSVVRYPRLAKNLPSKPTGIVVLVLPVELPKLRVRTLDLKRVRRGPEPNDGPPEIEIVDDLLHLVVREILKPEEDNQEIGGLERLQPRDVRAARLDEAGLGI